MRQIIIGTTRLVEVHGHYGISAFTPDRVWKVWSDDLETFEDARITIRNLSRNDDLPADAVQKWSQPNGWRIVEVKQTASVVDGEPPAPPGAPEGMAVETRFEIQGLYRVRGGADRAWERCSTQADISAARSEKDRLDDVIERSVDPMTTPSATRIVAIHRLVRVESQPDIATLPNHDPEPAPNPAHSALIYHVRGQPAAYRVTWAEDGYHTEDRPQMGPLPVDAHHLRRESTLMPLI